LMRAIRRNTTSVIRIRIAPIFIRLERRCLWEPLLTEATTRDVAGDVRQTRRRQEPTREELADAHTDGQLPVRFGPDDRSEALLSTSWCGSEVQTRAKKKQASSNPHRGTPTPTSGPGGRNRAESSTAASAVGFSHPPILCTVADAVIRCAAPPPRPRCETPTGLAAGRWPGKPRTPPSHAAMGRVVVRWPSLVVLKMVRRSRGRSCDVLMCPFMSQLAYELAELVPWHRHESGELH
jgi:hypothetical protein